jgi:hypothetical protein
MEQKLNKELKLTENLRDLEAKKKTRLWRQQRRAGQNWCQPSTGKWNVISEILFSFSSFTFMPTLLMKETILY